MSVWPWAARCRPRRGRELTAQCPQGKTALSAGFSTKSESLPSEFVPVLANGLKPSPGQLPTGWLLGSPEAATLEIYLLCY